MLDLFGHALAPRPVAPSAAAIEVPASRARPVLPLPQLPSGTIQWERLIGEVEHLAVTIQVSTLWTGEVLEVLSGGRGGRKALFRDGSIRPLPGAAEPERLAYLTPAQGQALHARHGLVLLGKPGDSSARFRFPEPGEDTSATDAILSRLATAGSASHG